MRMCWSYIIYTRIKLVTDKMSPRIVLTKTLKTKLLFITVYKVQKDSYNISALFQSHSREVRSKIVDNI